MDVGQFLDIAAHRKPRTTAIIFGKHRITYQGFRDRVLRLMTGLSHLGVGKGDRVATFTWNRPEMMEVHLAALRLGALFTPLNFRLREEELAYVLGDSAPSVLVTDTRCADTLGRVVEDYLSPERVFCTGGATGRGFPPYERLLEGQTPFRGRVNIQAADPCQLLYTSGTTARPKGVVLTHENVLWNAFNMIHARRDRPDDVALVVGPLFHAAALNSHFVPRLALGSTMVISEKFDPEEMMQTVRREAVTVVPGNPTLFIMLLEHCSGKQYNASSVRTLTSGADKLPDPVKRALLELFPACEGIFDVYGLTECGPCVTCLDARDSLRKTACVGPPLPFVQVRLLDEKGRAVPTGNPGEVVVRGPNVMKGYYNLPEETDRVLRDGWFYSGDLARADDEGFLYIVDRKKDMIVSGGENVSAREVEEVLFRHPDVLKAAVFGIPDPKWGEAVCAAVVPRSAKAPSPDAIASFLKQRLAGYKVPKRIYFLEHLPESGTGKVRKADLKKMFSTSGKSSGPPAPDQGGP